ncbi:amidohydrolase family protein [Arthrobacter sp. NPDC080031]|uniref:amidohydrolase family protein n=1 Tax=Arthrobacter sp. NPDC080031 TaxID=3155918 RepID=UPI00344BBCF5
MNIETAPSDVAVRTVDAAVYPSFKNAAELREYLPRPYRDRPFPGVLRYLFAVPTGVGPYGTYSELARESEDAPGSDPLLAARHVAGYGSSDAVLMPLTRGVNPNLDLGSAICAATNDWLAAKWLPTAGEVRFHGTIRVNPLDVDAAMREVQRWAGDDRFVQVGVPLESHMPYGHRVYQRLWDAIAEAGLPVAVRNDGYSGASFHPTPSGFPRHYAEFAALQQSNFIYHLTSLICEGVFDRNPGLRWVFTDGGFDVLTPLMWRMDMDWPITRVETPWVPRLPSEYLRDHVRFITSPIEGPPQELLEDWAEVSDAGSLLMYGSGYPMWSSQGSAEVFAGADPGLRADILGGNAGRFFRFRPTR